jgi:hypothetical protein
MLFFGLSLCHDFSPSDPDLGAHLGHSPLHVSTSAARCLLPP